MSLPSPMFRILIVSTGNVCRSPMAEAMLRHALTAALGPAARAFGVTSAGTWGHEGSPMEPYAEQVLAELGVPVTGFTARELAPEHLVVADLVLAATAEHREVVRAVDPFAAGRTYILGEFARYVRMVDPAALPPGDFVARARVLVERVGVLRSQGAGSQGAGSHGAGSQGAGSHGAGSQGAGSQRAGDQRAGNQSSGSGRAGSERPGRPRPGDDLADPLGAPLHVFRLCGERLAECLDGLVRALEPTWSPARAALP